MSQENTDNMKWIGRIEENRAALRRLRAQVSTLKLMLELQGLKVEAPERNVETRDAASFEAASAAL
jgi:hypothetical protein